MAKQRDELRRGRLVWTVIADPKGHRKERPVVVVSPADPANIVGVGVTTTYPDPPPPRHVELPWNADRRRVGTGLAQRSAAVTTWLAVIDAQNIRRFAGDVPAKIMAEIDRQLAELAKGKGQP